MYANVLLCTYTIAITVNFGKPSYTAREESKQVRSNLVFSNPSSFDITIQIMTSDDTAVSVNNNTECDALSHSNDYTLGLYSVTFMAMKTESFINVSICNDIVLEHNETFLLAIVSETLHVNVTTGDLDQASVIIIDNDRKFKQDMCIWLLKIGCFVAITIAFNHFINYADESNGTLDGRADVLAVLSNPSFTDIIVLVESNDITASKSHT